MLPDNSTLIIINICWILFMPYLKPNGLISGIAPSKSTDKTESCAAKINLCRCSSTMVWDLQIYKRYIPLIFTCLWWSLCRVVLNILNHTLTRKTPKCSVFAWLRGSIVNTKQIKCVILASLQILEIHLDESLQHPDNKCLQMDQRIALF